MFNLNNIGSFLQELVFPENYNTNKRGNTSNSESVSKKTKYEITEVHVEEVARKGNLNKLTVSHMKTFCQENKIRSSSQKKADLIAAINSFYNL